MDKKFGRHNFHRHTFCVFREVNIDLPGPGYVSKSGSQYVFVNDGVYRTSNHWGRAANCKWKLKPLASSTARLKTGFANWSDFHSDNDTERLYYITVDFETGVVDYLHRDAAEHHQLSILRTASATTKRIREIRNAFSETAWLDYCTDDRDQIQRLLVDKLVSTDEPVNLLKSRFRNQ